MNVESLPFFVSELMSKRIKTISFIHSKINYFDIVSRRDAKQKLFSRMIDATQLGSRDREINEQF